MTDVEPTRRGSALTAKTFSSPAFHRAQRTHFLLFDVLPAIGTVAAFALVPWLPPRPIDLVLFFVFWLVTGLGLTVGFHRLFAHRAFATRPAVAIALLVAGSMAARGAMISWVAIHRRHHECVDGEGDLHSPNAPRGGWRGLLHAHLTWMMRHDYPNVMVYAPDLTRQPALQRWGRHYHRWIVLGLVLPAAIGFAWDGTAAGALTGFLWGGVVRMFVVEHAISLINSVCHRFGRQPHAGRDNSRNNRWLALLTWGESHHNNHHAVPASAAFGWSWSELDPGYWLILALQRSGLAWDVRQRRSS